ncbi:MAG TPA: hypothetical protein VFI73_11940 [Candidatus Nitrosopolaris sp.]|nr:hypothetical protein [Candidatus Nitrosopolaris sp.]
MTKRLKPHVKDDGSDAMETKWQVDNAVCWLQNRYFTGEDITKFNESSAHLFKVNKKASRR